MRIATEGIFLGKVRFGDNGQILKIFTREAGLRSFVTKGRRNNKSATAACYFPLAPLTLGFDFRENHELQHLSELALSKPLPGLYDDPLRASVAGFLAEVLMRALEEHYVNQALFDFVSERTEMLATSLRFSSLHLQTLMGVAKILGFAPNVDGNGAGFDLSEGHRCTALEGRKYAIFGPEAEAFIRLSADDGSGEYDKSERSRLTDILLDYYRLHLPHMRPVRSVEVIKAVFS